MAGDGANPSRHRCSLSKDVGEATVEGMLTERLRELEADGGGGYGSGVLDWLCIVSRVGSWVIITLAPVTGALV